MPSSCLWRLLTFNHRNQLTSSIYLKDTNQGDSAFLGLAPFLRMNLAGKDLLPIGQEMMARIELEPNNANLWMNLSTVMLCLGQRDLGLQMQAQALQLQRIYHLAAFYQPAKLRLLTIMVPDDLAGNTPLDCLLENSDIDLIYYYVLPEAPLISAIPEHDVLMVAISESDQNLGVLAYLAKALAAWPKPVINAPQKIPAIERRAAAMLLKNVPGLLIPPTFRVSRSILQEITTGYASLSQLYNDCDFPVIIRPVGSHAGNGLSKIECSAEIVAYLNNVEGTEFFVSPFIDYSGNDGLFRKYRVALVDGLAYACHMAISSDWMIHYLNAGMYVDELKRAEEAAFMANFRPLCTATQIRFGYHLQPHKTRLFRHRLRRNQRRATAGL